MSVGNCENVNAVVKNQKQKCDEKGSERHENGKGQAGHGEVSPFGKSADEKKRMTAAR